MTAIKGFLLSLLITPGGRPAPVSVMLVGASLVLAALALAGCSAAAVNAS